MSEKHEFTLRSSSFVFVPGFLEWVRLTVYPFNTQKAVELFDSLYNDHPDRPTPERLTYILENEDWVLDFDAGTVVITA